jgi:hypothetical protein
MKQSGHRPFSYGENRTHVRDDDTASRPTRCANWRLDLQRHQAELIARRTCALSLAIIVVNDVSTWSLSLSLPRMLQIAERHRVKIYAGISAAADWRQQIIYVLRSTGHQVIDRLGNRQPRRIYTSNCVWPAGAPNEASYKLNSTNATCTCAEAYCSHVVVDETRYEYLIGP